MSVATRFMIPIDRYIDQKKRMIAWPSVAVGRREAGDVRIFFFFFGMRNHYSKYEITKGSMCSPASCRGRDTRAEFLTFLEICPKSRVTITLRASRFRILPPPFLLPPTRDIKGKTYDKMPTKRKLYR